jgi:antitoxin (DNA-binding transcriptional repressor) of toxin-antitoxin stability system
MLIRFLQQKVICVRSTFREAKTHLSRLIEEVGRGEETVLARNGQPVARPVPIEVRTGPRQPGRVKGRMHIHDDFDAPLPEDIVRAFGANE